jgi:hypothetical protein
MDWSDNGWCNGDWDVGLQHVIGMEVLPGGTLRHQGKWKNGNPVYEAVIMMSTVLWLYSSSFT